MKTALVALMAATVASSAAAQDGARPVYRCPGPPVLYTDALTPEEARARDCRTIEGAPVTVVQGARPRAASAPPPATRPGGTAPTSASAAGGGAGSRIDPAVQRARDSDARRILEAELKRDEQALAELKREFNNGEPERRGDERNYARYLERVSEMKAAITRKEADIAAIRRELAKLPP